jgi:hypothetical protein
MSKIILIGWVLLSGVLIAGCGKSDQAAAPRAAPANSGMPAIPGVDSSKINAAVDQAKQTGAAVVDKSKQVGAEVADKAQEAGAQAVDKTKQVAGDATGTAQSEGQKLMAQVTDYIKQNKLDDANTALTKLEGMKSSLPQSMQDGITSLRDQLTKAKAAMGGVKIPGMGN